MSNERRQEKWVPVFRFGGAINQNGARPEKHVPDTDPVWVPVFRFGGSS